MHNAPNISNDILIEDERWNEMLPDYAALVAMSLDYIIHNIDPFSNTQEIELSVTLSNDAHIQALNRTYRNKDKPTNVLSFPQIDWKAHEPGAHDTIIMLGDVIIALETIEREAREQDKHLQDHFIHMLIHSVLHLCGYDHENESDAEIMENLEIYILNKMGIKNPYQTPQ